MQIKLLKSQKGSSIPELLVAAGVVLMISSIVLAGVKAFTEQRKKINVTLMALSLQSHLQASLRSPDNYPKSVQETLKAGQEEYKSLEFKSTWTNENPEDNHLATLFSVGKNISFDLDKKSYDVSDTKGVLRLYTQMRKIGGSNKSFPLYKLGYRIVFVDPKIPHLGSPLAEDQDPADFDDSDFIETISHVLYMGKTGNELGKVECDPQVDVGIHGFSRDTGEPICIEKIYSSPPPKSFPRTLEFVSGYYGDNAVSVKPHLTLNYIPFRSFTPRENYIFQRINTLAFDPNGPQSGITYVFIYKKNINFYTGAPLTGWGSATAKCPTSYYAVAKTSGFCRLADSRPINGVCTREVPGATPSDDPTTESYPCAPDCGPGSNISYSGGGASATCTYNPPRCPNGGSHTGMLAVTTSDTDCTLTEAETRGP